MKIKYRGLGRIEKKIKLLETLCKNEIHVTKVFNATDGFAALVLREEHADNISRVVKDELDQNGLSLLCHLN